MKFVALIASLMGVAAVSNAVMKDVPFQTHALWAIYKDEEKNVEVNFTLGNGGVLCGPARFFGDSGVVIFDVPEGQCFR